MTDNIIAIKTKKNIGNNSKYKNELLLLKTYSILFIYINIYVLTKRKEWDLNPRYNILVYKDLADLHFKPLSHLFILKNLKDLQLIF